MRKLSPILSKAWRRIAPALPLSIVALLAVALAGLLASCLPDRPRINGPKPPSQQTIIVRVKISQPAAVTRISTTDAYRITSDGRTICESRQPLSADFAIQGNTWRINGQPFAGRRLAVEPVGSSRVGANSIWYRGSIQLIPQGPDTYLLVNHVDLESYIAGVIPKELMVGWKLETYRALAVAARTFAMYQRSAFGPGHDYDLGDGESSQVYGGYSAEVLTPNARLAVDSTRAQVLAYNQGGTMRIFLAQYSACCGGVVNGAYVIRNAPDDGPIRGGQVCNDCQACSRYRWPPVRVGKAELFRALMARYPQVGSLEGLSSVNVTSTTPYGRSLWVDVVGPNSKTVRLRAEDVRLAWNMSLSGTAYASTRRLPSMNCVIRNNWDSIDFTDGRGFGHGVGLCQWGANGKAARGWTGEQILSFYYPGCSLIRAY